jgi:CRISPR-associated protein Cas2
MLDFDIQRRLYLVCYDIADHKIRHGIHRIVRTYASGGQKSAYECYLSISEQHTLNKLVGIKLEEGDSFVIQPIIKPNEIRVLGVAIKPINSSFTLVS